MKQPHRPNHPEEQKRRAPEVILPRNPQRHERVIRFTREAVQSDPIGLIDGPQSSDSAPANASTKPSQGQDDMLSLGKAVEESDEQLMPLDTAQASAARPKHPEINLLKICPEFTLTGEKPEEAASVPPADANRTGRRSTTRRRPLLPPPAPGLLDRLGSWIVKKLQ